MSLISNCGRDERYQYSGGKAGDQDGGEWALIPWYSRPWDVVLRHPDKKVQDLIAQLAKEAAKNDNIGYDQYQRLDFYYQLAAVGYYPSKIKVPCEADCSSGTATIVKAVGNLLGIQKLQNVSISLTTWYIEDAFVAAGFQALKDKKILNYPDYLLPGDILLNTNAHVAINIEKGVYAAGAKETSTPVKTTNKTGIADKFSKEVYGLYKVNPDVDYLCLRSSADTSLDENILLKMMPGTGVTCYGYYTEPDGVKWLYAICNGTVGFCSSEYLTKL